MKKAGYIVTGCGGPMCTSPPDSGLFFGSNVTIFGGYEAARSAVRATHRRRKMEFGHDAAWMKMHIMRAVAC